MNILRSLGFVFILTAIVVTCSYVFAQTSSDTTRKKVEASEDPIFVCTKDSTKVYKWQAPDAPIIGFLNKGDTLDMIWLSDYYAAIFLKDTIRGIIEKRSYKEISNQ